MARRRRSEQHGYFHLWNRGVDRQDIFIDDVDRRIFIELLEAAADAFGVEVHAYSLMSNHFHLVVNCPEGQLSSFAQRLQKRYVEHHNRRVDRVGPLFTGRFSSTVLSDDEGGRDGDDLMMVMVRYVHRNPLDRMPLAALADDPFSSYGVYVGRRAGPKWLRTDLMTALHGTAARLQAFTERTHPSDQTPEHGRDLDPHAAGDVVACVADLFGIDPADVVTPRAGLINPVRDLAVHLCVELRTAGAVELATSFAVTPRALRRSAARGKDRCGVDAGWARHRDAVERRLHDRDIARHPHAA